jgi:hypothetical protein
MKIHFVSKSSNSKTGPIPVTYSARETCPPSCPLSGSNGCYAEDYYTRMTWDKVPKRGESVSKVAAKISALPPGTLWRHNVAGDLPGIGEDVDARALRRLVNANVGRLGYTYTHKKNERSLKLAKNATKSGFAINISCDSIDEVDRMIARGMLAVVVLPTDTPRRVITPEGNVVEQCPATYPESNVTCATCKLCARTNRRVSVGFPAHGTRRKMVNLRLIKT